MLASAFYPALPITHIGSILNTILILYCILKQAVPLAQYCLLQLHPSADSNVILHCIAHPHVSLYSILHCNWIIAFRIASHTALHGA